MSQYDDVIQLGAQQSPDDRGEDHVAHGLRIVSAAKKLGLRHRLPNQKAQQHRDPESGKGHRSEAVGERMMHDGMRQDRHALISPGMGRFA